MGATSEMYIQMQDEIMQTIGRAEDGNMTHLDAVLELRGKRSMLEDAIGMIKQFEDDQQDQIQREAEQYQNEYKGYKFEFRSGRQSFVFKGIPQWEKLEAAKKAFEDQGKAAFKLYQKTGSKPITEDGEELPLPEVKYGKGYMVVKELK